MFKKKKKKSPVRETPEFKELAKELRQQVPDEKKQLQKMLDEIIEDGPQENIKVEKND